MLTTISKMILIGQLVF